MTTCFFASDLHGRPDRYEKLLSALAGEKPDLLFLGGDLLPPGLGEQDFVSDYLAPACADLRAGLKDRYPRVFLILGNDDPRSEEPALEAGEKGGLWLYAHNRRLPCGEFAVYGYSCIPPSPFLLKDWERYDISRFVDVGCVPPAEGRRTVPVPAQVVEQGTIQEDLERLAGGEDLSRAIFLFHVPPYQTGLDRTGLEGRMVDHAPLDLHAGSIAVKRFIEARQPFLTLHGHIHESARITGRWRERIGRTLCFQAAHDGPQLALIEFSLQEPEAAVRVLR